MSNTDDEDGEIFFVGNGSSSENEIVESRLPSRNPGRELARNPLRQLSINNGLSKNSKQSLFLGNSRKPSYGSSPSNSSEKIKSLPLPPSKAELENLPLTKNNAELENSPRIKRKSNFFKNLLSKNRKLFNNGERDGNIGRMDSSSLPTGSGSQMLTNNNSKTYKNGADSNQIGEIFPYESDEESDSTILDVAEMTFNGEGSLDNHLNNKIHSVAKSRTSPKASNLSDRAVDKKSSLNIQEKVVLEKDQKDFESDVTRKRTFNHMKIKIPAVEESKTSLEVSNQKDQSTKFEKKSSFNVVLDKGEMLEMSKLSTPEFGELFGLRLKTSAEMKKGVVGHKSRRLRKPKTKYSP